MSQGRDQPSRFLKLTYQRTSIDSWGDTTTKGQETISRSEEGNKLQAFSMFLPWLKAGTLEMKGHQEK